MFIIQCVNVQLEGWKLATCEPRKEGLVSRRLGSPGPPPSVMVTDEKKRQELISVASNPLERYFWYCLMVQETVLASVETRAV